MASLKASLDAILHSRYALEIPPSLTFMPIELRDESREASAAPVLRRRAGTSADPLKKVTFRLHSSVATAIRGIVSSGSASSADAFVEDAVVARLRELRREKVYADYAAAAQDAAFMNDMSDAVAEFESTIVDGIDA